MGIESERPKEHARLSKKEWEQMIAEDAVFLGEELDRDMNQFPLEKRSLIKTIGAGTLALALAVGLGYKYVDIYRDDITAMQESRWAESGFVPKPELSPCQKITRDTIPAKAGRLVASAAGLCKAELAGMNSAPKTIVSFNNAAQH